MTDVYSKLTTSIDPRPMNFSSRNGIKIDRIVVHHNATTNKDVALSTWLQSGAAQTSAHYEVTPTEIIGCVSESDAAWHCGGTGGSDVPRMANPNQRSIGIENLNSTGAPSWQIDPRTMANLAKLVKDICNRYGIPCDRNHVLGHNEVTSTACPGGINVDEVVRLANGGTGSAAVAPVASDAKTVVTDVTYALRSLNGGWLDSVTNFGSGDNGYAGIPNQQHDYLTVSVSHGSVKYRVKTAQDGWLGWVTGSNRNDLANGAAGVTGHAITGVQIVYNTPAGEAYQQAYYRSQTTQRAGWLGVCADDGSIAGFDSWAGIDGEPLDRLQIKIAPSNPF